MKTTQQFLKGLIMTLVALTVTIINNHNFNWLVLLIILAGTPAVYFLKNLIPDLRSNSQQCEISGINIISTILIAAGIILVAMIASVVEYKVINWSMITAVTITVTLTYLCITLFAGPHSSGRHKIFTL